MEPRPTRARILGTGRAIPERVVTNDELAGMVDTSNEWIIERTGIEQRRIADPKQVTSELCEAAARIALDRAGITPDELDLIVVGTATPDMVFPSCASLVQHRLGTSGQMAYDTMAACSGFLYGLAQASQFVETGRMRYALVIGAELLSRIVDWEDRGTCVLFGDGAGAVVIGPSEDPDRGILGFHASADGAVWPSLHMPAGGSKLPSSSTTVKGRLHFIKMEGNEVYRTAVRSLMASASGVLKACEVDPEEVDLFIPHQANKRIIDAVAKRLDIGEDKLFLNIQKYGNTSAASIPIALDEAVEEGRVDEGDVVLLDAFGAGATTAAVLVRW